MPKGRKVVKTDGRTQKFNVKRKLRIGTRKSGQSAFQMTTEALKTVLERSDQKRYHNKARAALAMRGVAV